VVVHRHVGGDDRFVDRTRTVVVRTVDDDIRT
jgi:hypothetical protein